MLHKISIWLMTIACFLSFTQYINANSPTAEEPIQMHLILENETIQPGKPFWVAVKMQLKDGWHSYWKNPGDAGVATAINWQLPEGFTAGAIQWPLPKRFAVSAVIGYGYDSEVILLTQITPPTSIAEGQKFTLKANVSWLVCSDDSCLPGEAQTDLTVSVNNATPQISRPAAEVFARGRALLPKTIEGVSASHKKGTIQLKLPMPESGLPTAVYFCPESSDVVDHAVDPVVTASPDSAFYILSLKEKEGDPSERVGLKGVVVATHASNGTQNAIDVNVPMINGKFDDTLISMADKKPSRIHHGEQVMSSPAPQEFTGGLGMALLFAFLGGMILNLMPCVLPVISFKIMSFVKMAGQSRTLTIKHGVAFSVGVLASFWVLAGVLLVLQAYGRSVGWGFQLQEPIFVAFLAAVLLAFGLSLFGVFEVGNTVTSWAGSVAKPNEGLISSFLSGILATAVATPCTGPFLGSAVGFAVTLPPIQAMLIFTFLGLGMSAPYLFLAIYPNLLRFLPKPGDWMDTFRQIMGFLMLATVLWLVWVFGAQTSSFAVTLLLGSFFLLSIGLWVYGKWSSPVHTRASRFVSTAVAVACLCAASYTVLLATSGSVAALDTSHDEKEIAWEPFSQKRIDELQKKGIPVLVDFTAKWCLICQLNHIVLSTTSIDTKLTQLGVVRMKADWTKNDPAITEQLSKHGRNSVPLYLLYGKDPKKGPEILPQVLTQDIVLEHLAGM